MDLNKRRWLLCVLPFAGLGLANFAVGMPARLTGTFSNFEYHGESGDLNGLEIRLIAVRGGMKAVVQFAEGGAGEVLLVDVSITGNQIAFVPPAGFRPAFKFEGTVQERGLSGQVTYGSGSVEKVFLKRQPSYWDR